MLRRDRKAAMESDVLDEPMRDDESRALEDWQLGFDYAVIEDAQHCESAQAIRSLEPPAGYAESWLSGYEQGRDNAAELFESAARTAVEDGYEDAVEVARRTLGEYATRLLEGQENAWERANARRERRRAIEAGIEANAPTNVEWSQVPARGRIAEDGKAFDYQGHPYSPAA